MRNILLWLSYDFANSLFTAAVGTSLYFSQWIVLDKGFDDIWYGAIFSAATILLLVTAPFWGAWSDRTGQRMPFIRVLSSAMIIAGLGLSFVAVLVALLLAPLAFPRVPRWVRGRAVGGDLPWRMVAAAALVLAVSALAASVGPRLSGLFAMFPVMSTVLVGFSHRQSGGAFAVRLLRGMVAGYYAFACFCAVLALALPVHGIAIAFLAALATALPVHAAARRWAGL